jgi:hypothetical protein
MTISAKIRHQKKTEFPSSSPAPIVNIANYRSRREALQPDRKPIVFLATPTLSGNVNFSIALAFSRALASNSLAECPFQFIVHFEVGKRPADYARNCIVRAFLDSDADWLYMIDEDQVVPDNFWHLLTIRDADVIAGLCPVWVGNMDPEAMLRINAYGVDDQARCFNLPNPPADMTQPYRIPVAGTGAIAIRRRVFSQKPKGVGDAPFYFTYLDDRKVRGGEDVNFSVDCQRAGFMVAAHPGVRFDHMKTLPLAQIGAYYEARSKMEREGRQLSGKQVLSIG